MASQRSRISRRSGFASECVVLISLTRWSPPSSRVTGSGGDAFRDLSYVSGATIAVTGGKPIL